MENIKFTDGIRQYKVIEFIEKFNMYRLKNYTENKESELMKLEQIENYINNAEYYNNRYNKGIERKKEYDDKKKIEVAAEEEAKKKYNFCYGYTDNKTDLQKGKILKALNQEIIFMDKVTTKKDMIHSLITPGSRTLEYYNTNRVSKKKIEGCYKKLVDKLEYRFYVNESKSNFYEVTKTECDYINYLLTNIYK